MKKWRRRLIAVTEFLASGGLSFLHRKKSCRPDVNAQLLEAATKIFDAVVERKTITLWDKEIDVLLKALDVAIVASDKVGS